jgi:drug/metabolite transporter (DMT)-like permease
MGYGLLCALLWGTADFFARLAAERVGTRRALFGMQLLSLLGTSAVLAIPATWPPRPSAAALALAGGIGLFNLAGAALLYRALEIGTVSLVSPVSSSFAAVTALLAVGVGERPGRWATLGLFVTVAGVIGASLGVRRGAGATGAKSAPRTGIGLAATAAVTWGVSFFALRYVVSDLGAVFPMWMSRVVSVVALGAVSLARRRGPVLPSGAWRWVIGVALFDSAAFVSYNHALSTALTSIVSVLAALYSAVTVVLAGVVLRERLAPRQWAAVALTLAGVALVASGG